MMAQVLIRIKTILVLILYQEALLNPIWRVWYTSSYFQLFQCLKWVSQEKIRARPQANLKANHKDKTNITLW